MPQNDLPAIPAEHNALADELISRLLIQWPLWSQFDRIWLRLDAALPNPSDGPLICYMNHSTWWDGYIALALHRMVFRRSLQGYLMMDERQLRRYKFFRWLGVFSVSQTDSREAMRSVNYIARLLGERRDRYLWMFPQGKLLPNDQRPLRLYPGLARIARLAGGATLQPIALRFEFRDQERPEIFIRFGPAHRVAPTDSDRLISQQATQHLTTTLDQLRDDVLQNNLVGYRTMLYGRPGINRIGDALFAAAGIRRKRQ